MVLVLNLLMLLFFFCILKFFSFPLFGMCLTSIRQETLRVKDEELHQLLQDIRARDSTIMEIADKLQETAEAAQTAASAAHSIDEVRRILFSELERLKQDQENQVELSLLRVTTTS